jgi:hypothetical protein
MEAYSNKRVYARYNLDAPIMYASEENRYAYYGAKTLNYSKGGLCFETPYPLQQGMVISIRKADHTPESRISSKYTEQLAEVKWCKEIFYEDRHAFGAGVMFQAIAAEDKPFFINDH